MDDRLNELKEKQAEIGDKISLLQQTNKKKDEEAAEIRQLIAECRENLNRIKGIAPGSEPVLAPCAELEERGISLSPRDREGSMQQGSSSDRKGTSRDTDSTRQRETSDGEAREGDRDRSSGARGSERDRERTGGRGSDRDRTGGRDDDRDRRPCGSRTSIDRKRCAELLAKAAKEDSKKSKKCGRSKGRVSCKVDLNKMKVRIRGPSEDLKKLDATQLINLLEKFQCQELIINTGEDMMQDPGEIRLVYFLHPGNIVMVAGIIMIAFLINTNLCSPNTSYKKELLLKVLYLGSFAFHYGMVFWMSFIRGIALKFGLSDDMYHLVDNLILPKYYSVCVLLSALSLYSFLATHCVAPCTSWPLQVLAQMIVIVITFIMELFTICYIIPALIKLRSATDDYAVDDEENECAIPESYEKNCIKLGKLSWTLCLINFLTLLFLGANIYYLTCRLDICYD